MTSIPASTMASLGIKRFLGFLMLALCAVMPSWAQHLQEGDLLFACSDSANAITAVTSGFDQMPIDHVGIVHRIGGDEGPLYVIEAIKPVVTITPIDTFMCRNAQLLVGRVNVDVDFDVSVNRCLSMVGRPYDDVYLPGDSALYCSELVQLNYVHHDGTLVFDPVPMSFHDSTGQVTDYWKEFYSVRGMTVPEGAPGTNPGELSRRHQVTIIGTICSGIFRNDINDSVTESSDVKKTEN